MRDLMETELLRARWRRALARHGLDRTDREDFAATGLASRLETVTTQLLLLPADPEGDVVIFDKELAAWLKMHSTVSLTTGEVSLGENIRLTAHAAALTEHYSTSWTSYLALYRSGALEIGLGARGGWAGRDHNEQPVRAFALTPTVARVWAVLRIAAASAERHGLACPYQLTVALRGAGGALLGALGEGWAELGSLQNRVGPCQDDNLLWHLELNELPDEDGQRRLAYAIGDRIENAWGVPEHRYLAARGSYEGELDPRHIN